MQTIRPASLGMTFVELHNVSMTTLLYCTVGLEPRFLVPSISWIIGLSSLVSSYTLRDSLELGVHVCPFISKSFFLQSETAVSLMCTVQLPSTSLVNVNVKASKSQEKTSN